MLKIYNTNLETNKIEEIKINGSLTDRLPGNINVSFKDIDASTMLIKLDEFGICASAGSACNTGSTEPSHVLTSIGLEPNYANGALRVTFGDDNTKDDVDFLVDCIINIKKNMESL